MKNRLTKAKLRKIRAFLKDCPNACLVYGVQGIVTCDGYAIEFDDGKGRAGVIHPLAYLDLMEEACSQGPTALAFSEISAPGESV